MDDEVIWITYPFKVCDFGGSWNAVGGVYIFSGIDHQNGWWEPLYVGQTDSFRNRIPFHERWAEAVQLGATHVHATVVPQAAMRAAVERHLIEAYQPPLNIQFRSLSLADFFRPLGLS